MSIQDRPAIPGESGLTRRIRAAAARDALGHAVVLSGRGNLGAAARFLAAAMECRDGDKPCGVCPDCRKVLRDIHPDVVTVTDPEHKNIAVDVLRETAADASVLPNEGRRKVYIFPDCSLLDSKAQNVLLKVVEDGSSHAAFVFCAENSAVLLPTIRSRTVEWKLSPPEETGPSDERARQLCEILCSGGAPELAAFCSNLENRKIPREELQGLLSDARDLVVSALSVAIAGGGGGLAVRMAQQMGKYRLSAAADTLERFIQRCKYNIGVGHLLGALSVELEG